VYLQESISATRTIRLNNRIDGKQGTPGKVEKEQKDREIERPGGRRRES